MKVTLKVTRFHNRYDFEYDFDMQDDLLTHYMTKDRRHLEYGQDEQAMFESALAQAKVEVKGMIVAQELAKKETMKHNEIKTFEFETEL